MVETNELCRCGHDRCWHRKDGECSAAVGFKFCQCAQFKLQESDMPKKAANPKSEGPKPKLAPYVDNPFKIYATSNGKEYEAQVLKSGMIVMGEKEFTSPSAAAKSILRKNNPKAEVDGWHFWKFNKDGDRVALSELRPAKDIAKRSDKKEARPKPAPAKPRKPKAAKKTRSPKTPGVSEGASVTERAAELTGSPLEDETAPF